MLKRWIVRLAVTLTLAAMVTGGYVVAGEIIGIDLAPTIHACSPSMGSGGGC